MTKMKLEQQVVSLELSKHLKKLGFEQESLWYWFQHCNKVHQGNEKYDPEFLWKLQPYFKGLNIDNACSAYTVAELIKMLPKVIGNEIERTEYWMHTHYSNNFWRVSYDKYDCCLFEEIKAKTEADARAKMLIYLKENNLL